jgi:hypothetical protein
MFGLCVMTEKAILQADGTVLIAGGVDAQGTKVERDEVYDPKTQSFNARQRRRMGTAPLESLGLASNPTKW